ncbi:E3 ubiquitin-protein ligase Topors [Trichogramma pretiosum]|uniref:E3 ubiquitin-protein ligase Topors n=1 Tax=Trichogramma pretiosum TaxID=7493 RepID=UPI0006C9C3A3|nr:E3 ubiquitin-protein ligase Topors [Trichogramma pretiosum]
MESGVIMSRTERKGQDPSIARLMEACFASKEENGYVNDERPSSPPPHCSICLEDFVNKSFCDTCLHPFCFTCLLEWSRIKNDCPLCKQIFKTIIHNVRAEGVYDEFNINYPAAVNIADTQNVPIVVDLRDRISRNQSVPSTQGSVIPFARFMYRTTVGSNQRYRLIHLNPEAVRRQVQLPVIRPPREENQDGFGVRRQRYQDPLHFRTTIYAQNMWARPVTDIFGRVRQCSADSLRRHPAERQRLIPFLSRELTALLANNPGRVAYVMNVILTALSNNDCNMYSANFINVVREHVGPHTDHFIHELANFANSHFDLYGYDRCVTYGDPPTRPIPVNNDSDSDILILDDTSSINESSAGPSNIEAGNSTASVSTDPLAPPSFLPRAVQSQEPTSSLSSPQNSLRNLCPPGFIAGPSMPVEENQARLATNNRTQISPPERSYNPIIISSSSESEDECQIVGYVKPRHERTPVTIDLTSSSDGEIHEEEFSPPTFHIRRPANIPTIRSPSPRPENLGHVGFIPITIPTSPVNQRPNLLDLFSRSTTSDSSITDSDSNSDDNPQNLSTIKYSTPTRSPSMLREIEAAALEGHREVKHDSSVPSIIPRRVLDDASSSGAESDVDDDDDYSPSKRLIQKQKRSMHEDIHKASGSGFRSTQSSYQPENNCSLKNESISRKHKRPRRSHRRVSYKPVSEDTDSSNSDNQIQSETDSDSDSTPLSKYRRKRPRRSLPVRKRERSSSSRTEIESYQVKASPISD